MVQNCSMEVFMKVFYPTAGCLPGARWGRPPWRGRASRRRWGRRCSGGRTATSSGSWSSPWAGFPAASWRAPRSAAWLRHLRVLFSLVNEPLNMFGTCFALVPRDLTCVVLEAGVLLPLVRAGAGVALPLPTHLELPHCKHRWGNNTALVIYSYSRYLLMYRSRGARATSSPRCGVVTRTRVKTGG